MPNATHPKHSTATNGPGEGVDFGRMLFPGRSSLTVSEVADALQVVVQHVFDLIEEGQLGAVDVGGGKRKHWRVPVPEYEKFLRSRASK